MTFNTGVETEVQDSKSPLIARLIKAAQVKKSIEVFYRSGSRSTYQQRSITPLKVFTASANLGVIYIRAKSDGEEKLFRADKMAVLDFNRLPLFLEPPICPTCKEQVESFEIDLAKKKMRPTGSCSNCSGQTSSDSTVSKEQSSTSRVARDSDRPTCIVVGCDKPAEIKERVNGKPRYRKTCSACRRKHSKTSSSADGAELKKERVTTKESVSVAVIKPNGFEQDSSVDQTFMGARFKELREKLLDFSRRNPLINFSHSERGARFIRVVDEVPDELLETLVEGTMEFKPLPDLGTEPPDEKTPEFQAVLSEYRAENEDFLAVVENEELANQDPIGYEQSLAIAERELRNLIREELGLPKFQGAVNPDLREHAKAHNFDPSYDLPLVSQGEAHEDSFIQTLMIPDDLDRRLRNIYQRYQDYYRETGINILHVAFGFIEWTESKDSEKANVSPLMLLPVSMERKKTRSGYAYEIHAESDQAEPNETLLEKVRSEFGIDMPPLEEEMTLAEYFAAVVKAVSGFKAWKVRPFVTLGLFPFQKISIYRDMFPDAWGAGDTAQNITSHDSVARLLGGKASNETAFLDHVYDVDELTARGDAPPIILEADSSQHSAIHEVFNGQSLVIQGPPGTGKSQTIANLIAAAVSKRKRVLFVAEKKPALDVVASRLKAVGLGPLMLEPNARGSKIDFLESLKERLDTRTEFNEALYSQKKDELIRRLGFNDKVRSLLSKSTDYCSFTFFELAWRYIRLQHSIAHNLRSAVSGCPVSSIQTATVESFYELIDRFVDLQENEAREIPALTTFSKLLPNSISINEFIESANKLLVRRTGDGSYLEEASHFTIDELMSCSQLVEKIDVSRLCSPDTLREERDYIERSGDVSDLISRTEEVVKGLSAISEDDIENLILTVEEGGAVSLGALQSNLNQNEAALKRVAGVCSDFKLKGRGEVDFSLVNSALDSLGDVSESVSEMLTSSEIDFDDSRLIDVLEDLRDQIEKSESDFDRLGVSLSFDEITDLDPIELSEHSDSIQGAGLFSLLSSKVGKAKAFMQSIGLDPKNQSDRQKLARLAGLVELAQELSVERKYKRILGSAYRGINTSAEHLASLHRLLRDLRYAANSLQVPVSTAARLVDLAVDSEVRSLINKMSGGANLSFSDFVENSSAQISRFIKGCNCLESIGLASSDLLWGGSIKELGETLTSRFQELSNAKNYECFRPALQLLREEKKRFDSQGRSTDLSLGEIDEYEAFYDDFLDACNDKCDEISVYKLVAQTGFNLFDGADKYAIDIKRFCDQFGAQDIQRVADIIDILEQAELLLKHDPSQIVSALSKQRFKEDCSATIWPEFFDIQELESESYDTLCDVFEYGVILNVLREFASDNNVSLVSLESGSIMKNRAEFRRIDNELRTLEANRTLHVGVNDFGSIPVGNDVGAKKTWTDLKLINNELGKKKRHISIRQLILRARRALLVMKPVWLMDPISVSQFLPKSRELFDLVIIDEASQMLPESAIASIVRGKQLVVVGDDMQMPPSQFFGSGLDYDDEEEQQVDAESILDLAGKRLGNTISLRWHYRSRHDSLISFSNKYFYGDRLEVFPSPRHLGGTLGVKRVDVKGSYKQGVNVPEAQAVIVQLKQCMSEYPEESIGVVAMNAKQQDYINEQLNMLKDTDPVVARYFDRWEQDPLNSLFVKNLENVQGDERDTIIISTVYGPDADGNMFQRFPLINTATGHRRLNVLFTRAKNRVILVTSMRASDVKLDDNSHRGKKALRDYIEYAGTGRLESGEVSAAAQADSDFELHVMERLAQAGYKPVPQVGVKGFRIDIGVTHPDYPDGFIAGIECDGATYHSSPQARDRDKIRQDILQGLGWKIYRIWSTDWFSDPVKETEKMLSWLSQVWSPDRRSIPRKSDDQATPEEMGLDAEPSGTRRTVAALGKHIDYYSIDSEVFEVWNDGRYNGWVERERENRIEQATYGTAMNVITDSKFLAYVSLPDGDEVTNEFNSLERAVAWVYKESNERVEG